MSRFRIVFLLIPETVTPTAAPPPALFPTIWYLFVDLGGKMRVALPTLQVGSAPRCLFFVFVLSRKSKTLSGLNTRQQVAKKLPHLPRGVDPTNLRVVACVRRIAAEAGELCASDTIEESREQVCCGGGVREEGYVVLLKTVCVFGVCT